jgi:hypothetical protein
MRGGRGRCIRDYSGRKEEGILGGIRYCEKRAGETGKERERSEE